MAYRVQTVLLLTSPPSKRTTRANSLKQLSRNSTTAHLKTNNNLCQTLMTHHSVSQNSLHQKLITQQNIQSFVMDLMHQQDYSLNVFLLVGRADTGQINKVVQSVTSTSNQNLRARLAETSIYNLKKKLLYTDWLSASQKGALKNQDSKPTGEDTVYVVQLEQKQKSSTVSCKWVVIARTREQKYMQEQTLELLNWSRRTVAASYTPKPPSIYTCIMDCQSENNQGFKYLKDLVTIIKSFLKSQKKLEIENDKENRPSRNRTTASTEREFVIKPNKLGKMVVEYDYYHKDPLASSNQDSGSHKRRSACSSVLGNVVIDQHDIMEYSNMIVQLQIENKSLRLALEKERQEFSRQTQKYIEKKNNKISSLNEEISRLKNQISAQVAKNDELAKSLSDTRVQFEVFRIEQADQAEQNRTQNMRLQEIVTISQEELRSINFKLQAMDRKHSVQMEQLENQVTQYQRRLETAEAELEIGRVNEERYLQEISRLEYKYHKERSKYCAERDKADRLAGELQLMDRKLNQIISLKQSEIDALEGS